MGFLFLVHPVNAESVLWISATSSIFSRFFYIWGFLAYTQWRQKLTRWRYYYLFLSMLGFVLGLASHEMAITFPLIIFLYDLIFFISKKQEKLFPYLFSYVPFLVLTGVYFWIRKTSGAHGLSGDYSYNFKNLPFNFIGNLFGYTGELIFSYPFVAIYDSTRFFLREHKLLMIPVMGILIVFVFLILKKTCYKKIKTETFKTILFFLGWYVILLFPFLGLGNIAERYVYLAHGGLLALLVLFCDWVFKEFKKRSLLAGLLVEGFTLIAASIFYYSQIRKTQDNWYQAGEIANKILLAISTNYAKFPPESSLYFVDLPIRYDRAWVYPVGLEDGLWFIYRDKSLVVNKATDLEKTFELVKGKPNKYVFVFEEGQLKEVKEQ